MLHGAAAAGVPRGERGAVGPGRFWPRGLAATVTVAVTAAVAVAVAAPVTVTVAVAQ